MELEDRKYIYIYNGIRVKLNDVLIIPYEVPFTGDTSNIQVQIKSESVIISLIEHGVPIEKIYLEDKKEKKENKVTALGTLINERFNSIPKDLNNYLDIKSNPDLSIVVEWMAHDNPLLLYSLYSRYIAYELDKTYNNNIRNCKILFCINDLDGKPIQIFKEDFSNKEWNNLCNNVALFRNEVDLIVCQKLLKPFKKYVWSGVARKE